MFPLRSSAPVILSIGEAMVELSDLDPDSGTAGLGFAGDTLNTAIYLARGLPPGGGQVRYVTRLGQDGLSDAMMRVLAAEGIDTQAITRDPDRLPGLYAIQLDPDGERSFLYWRSASAARRLFTDGPRAAEVLADADVIYLSGISLAILEPQARDALIAACGVAKQAGKPVIFDSNYRPRLWTSADEARAVLDRMWSVTSLGLPSADDERLLRPDATDAGILDRLSQAGVAEIVLKRGADGPVVCAAGVPSTPPMGKAARVVDTTAAGDSFNAGYIAARLFGAAPEVAAQAAHDLACQVIGYKGAILPRAAP